MPTINFQSQFAPGLLAMLDKAYQKRTGIKPKTTTIRKIRKKNAIKTGDVCYLYIGQRTKKCKKLGECYCKAIEPIMIDETRDEFIVKVDGLRLDFEKAQRLAREDGFGNITDMVRWFKMIHGLPFSGERIHFTTTYDRKYFCNKMVKEHGFKLNLEQTEKTIQIKQEDVEAAKSDRYIKELRDKHQYGVQVVLW
jgi:hypothetical protein